MSWNFIRPSAPRKIWVMIGLMSCFAVTEAYSQLDVVVGGGWSAPRGDSAAYVRNGLTGEVDLEFELGPNLSLGLGSAYTTLSAKSSKLKSDLGLPPADPLNSKMELIDVTLAPKLYLIKHDIAAFLTLGGGPRWITTHNTAAGTGIKSTVSEQAWGAVAGFGVDVAFTEGFAIGFAPAYHRVWSDRKILEYATFVLFVRI